MSPFGVDPAEQPGDVDALLGASLMAAMEGLEITARRVRAGKLHGERRSRRRGFSIDFAEHRPYSPGDDLRYVDWNVYARLDALFLKLYLDEEDLSVVLALDASASMRWGDPDKWTFTRRLAMALSSIALSARHRLSLAACAEGGVRVVQDIRGRAGIAQAGRWLLDAGADGGGDLEGSLRMLAASRRGRGVVVVLSDFLEDADPLSAFTGVTAGGDDLHCIQVLSPQELDPLGTGLTGDLRLEDAETGTSREVTVTPALVRAYRERLDARIGLVRDAARRAGGTHLAVSTETDVQAIVLEELRREGVVA